MLLPGEWSRGGSLAVLQSGADVSYAQQEFVLREGFPGKTAGRKKMLKIQVCLSLPFKKSVVSGALK